jgi:hypothetical protein
VLPSVCCGQFFFFLSSSVFETGSHYVAQASLELVPFLPQSPKCWDFRRMPLPGLKSGSDNLSILPSFRILLNSVLDSYYQQRRRTVTDGRLSDIPGVKGQGQKSIILIITLKN